jgi:hypothetical protein
MGGGKKFWEDYWEVLEEIPDGWVEDKTAGAPGSGMVFITNGKSILNGRKRALLKIKNLKKEDSTQKKKEIDFSLFVDGNKPNRQGIDEDYRKTFNALAR